jgi:uncharacterized protein YfaA (DUF2138 family)
VVCGPGPWTPTTLTELPLEIGLKQLKRSHCCAIQKMSIAGLLRMIEQRRHEIWSVSAVGARKSAYHRSQTSGMPSGRTSPAALWARRMRRGMNSPALQVQRKTLCPSPR